MTTVMHPLARRGWLLDLGTAAGLTVFAAYGFIATALWNSELAARGTTFYAVDIWLDHLIPLRPGWVWAYLSYYPMCFLPLFLWRRPGLLRRVALALALEFGVAFACFLLMPIRMQQPPVPGASVSAEVLRMVYSVDPGFNIFPSLHVANTVLVALVFHRLRVRPWAAWVILWAAAVSVSTVLVKQHYVVDVFAGVALAFAAHRVTRGPGPLPEARQPRP